MKLEICIALPLAPYAVSDLDAELPRPWLFWGTHTECAEFVLKQTAGEPEDCPAPDAWNCKYCRLTEQCKLHSAKAPKPFSELRTGHLSVGFNPPLPHVGFGCVFTAIDEGKPGSDHTAELQYSTENSKLQVHHIAIVEKGDPGAVILDGFPFGSLERDPCARRPAFIPKPIECTILPQTDEQRATWGNMTAEFAERLRDQYRKKYPHTELLLSVVIDAMRCGHITATTDWDTAEGAVRLRFVEYAGRQIAVRMHNGDITNVWINGESRYDAHQHN